jgi:ElaB/YqjD/DUF883 family membrane-anchored ribosome-binding protein
VNAILNDNDQVATGNGSGKVPATDARSATAQRRDGGNQEVHDLIADVQDLLSQMAHVADPEIARLRAKVADAVDNTKRAAIAGTRRVQRHATDAARAGDDYVRNQPWQAVGVAAVIGLVVGFLVAKR